MTDEELLKAMKEVDDQSDPEHGHYLVEKVLVEFLKQLGYTQSAEYLNGDGGRGEWWYA